MYEFAQHRVPARQAALHKAAAVRIDQQGRLVSIVWQIEAARHLTVRPRERQIALAGGTEPSPRNAPMRSVAARTSARDACVRSGATRPRSCSSLAAAISSGSIQGVASFIVTPPLAIRRLVRARRQVLVSPPASAAIPPSPTGECPSRPLGGRETPSVR